ncbi:rod shape-determining protein RodA [Parvularcula sp. LCG005]|uniref:rod shape-determining protein RodA n=1 Tax=Parvularcula sp. LCG005 TaxID=3078805 RepID=UPI002943BD86|nr:rod shape-determining protein RodA [Parvularcula sp. LCG005]WOI54118.1 rod shape-determining protein RodA [Parvularcula sp. LCG005]
MSTIMLSDQNIGVRGRFMRIHVLLIALLCALAGVGVMTLYSVAQGSWDPYATKHLVRFVVALCVLLAVAVTPLKFWLSAAYPVYFLSLGLLFLVPIIGDINMGARRWISMGGFQLQPSEIMKVALVMALARYYHGLEFKKVSTVLGLIPPMAMIGIPVGLVFIQPDLGTAILLALSGLFIVLLAGVSWRWVILGIFAALAVIVFGIQTGLLEAYQIKRVTAFLDPTWDPLGANFHPNQSKIAIGSGGVEGKGYMAGTQSQLGFLPEKHTDFIFTIFGEEFGLIGALGLLTLYFVTFSVGMRIALAAKSHFGRLLAMGVSLTLVMYVLINTGMVMGLAPVVGVPLPLVSYGGTVMLSMMIGFGFVMSVWIHRHQDTLRTPGWR